jgi:hypothetical protein
MSLPDKGRHSYAFVAIGRALRRWHNIEILATVFLAVVLFVLDILGIAKDAWISSATLAVLAVVGWALLKNVSMSEYLADSLSDPTAERFFARRQGMDDVDAKMVAARDEIFLWGTAIHMHVPYLERRLAELATRKVRVKVLLIKPAGGAFDMAVFRAGPNETSASLTDKLAASHRVLTRLLAAYPESIEVRHVDYLAPYTMYAYDPDSAEGNLDVRLSSFHGENDLRPTFHLRHKIDGAWFEYFTQQFRGVWAAADLPTFAPPQQSRQINPSGTAA